MKQTSNSAADRFSALIGRFPGCRALVIGDVILDCYLWGDTGRMSPEAPVPVVRVREETRRLGGAANVISNLAALGAAPRLIGVAGDDRNAGYLRHLLREAGVDPAGLLVDPARPTTVKTRVIAMNQQLIRLDREEPRRLPPALTRRILARFQKELRRSDVVLISDYAKGVLTGEISRELIRRARSAGKPVLVDPKGIDFAKYTGADVIKPNRAEAEQAAGIPIHSDKDLERAARTLRQRIRSRAIVLTCGGEGVYIFERRKKNVHIPAHERTVYDVTGAGDTFLAAMGLALARGATLADAARIGNAAGAVVVGKLGAATCEPGELLAALDIREHTQNL